MPYILRGLNTQCRRPGTSNMGGRAHRAAACSRCASRCRQLAFCICPRLQSTVSACPLKTELLVQASGPRIQRAEPNDAKVLSGLSKASTHQTSCDTLRPMHGLEMPQPSDVISVLVRVTTDTRDAHQLVSAFRYKQALPRSLETNCPIQPLVAFVRRTVRQSIDARGKKRLGPTGGTDFNNADCFVMRAHSDFLWGPWSN
jgi:hypothetical protein